MNKELKYYLYSIVGNNLTYEKKEKILMYFNKLHQENTRIKRKNKTLNKQNKDYKSRIEKAIEWCECVINSKTTGGELPNGDYTDMGYCLDLAEPLLKILQGDDEKNTGISASEFADNCSHMKTGIDYKTVTKIWN